MDWTANKFDWNQMRAFLITAEEGSFSAAADAMGLSQPTVSRQVAALEETLHVVLFEKSGRGLVLTPTGKELLEHAHRMGEAASDIALVASGKSTSLQGSVCISASEIVAGYILPKLTLKLHHAYPEIRIEILASNEASDLRTREADIAIRSFRPNQLDLIGKKLKTQYWGLYASTDFMTTHGSLDSISELENAKFIGFDQSDTLIKHLAKQNVQITETNIVVVAQNMLIAMELLKIGTGIGILPIDIGDSQPNIQRVASQIVQFDVENWLVTHSELRTNRRIQIVYDFLGNELSDF
jgi:DNA-binding transcriptional LysR family regulator